MVTSLHRPQISALQLSNPIAGGMPISSSDIRLVHLTTSDKAISTQFASRADIAGMVSKMPLAAGQLIELSDLANPTNSIATDEEMSVPLDSSRTPISQISPGDYIELIATIGSGSSAASRVVAAAVKVIGIIHTNSSIVGQGGQNGADLLLSIGNPVEAIAIAQAETAGSLVGVKVRGPATQSFQGVFSLSNPSAFQSPEAVGPITKPSPIPSPTSGTGAGLK